MDEKQVSNEPAKTVPTDEKKKVSATVSEASASRDEAPKV